VATESVEADLQVGLSHSRRLRIVACATSLVLLAAAPRVFAAGEYKTIEQEKLRILRLTDGSSEIAYGFSEVIDIRSIEPDLQAPPVAGEVAGVFLIDGAQVELLDPYWLFAVHAEARAEEGEPPVCALPEGDPWIDNMLRPLIESLGYRIVEPGNAA